MCSAPDARSRERESALTEWARQATARLAQRAQNESWARCEENSLPHQQQEDPECSTGAFPQETMMRMMAVGPISIFSVSCARRFSMAVGLLFDGLA